MKNRTHHVSRSVVFVACLAAITAGWAAWQQSQSAATQSVSKEFAQLVGRFSEAGGWFDTDNLISNEKSYLHVVPQLEHAGVSGGVYIGVGPDQNFSYIARIRPEVAFIVDIRRDNLLLHLMFKALFAISRNRMEYLAHLTGTRAPEDIEGWSDASINGIVAYLDRQTETGEIGVSRRLQEAVRAFGVPVSDEEMQTIHRFHAELMNRRLSLRFHSQGRLPRSYYPTYRELLLETDREGRQLSYLASEADYQFLRSLQARGGVIPVVGDLGGTHALSAIGKWMKERNQHLAAFYVSNVEDYLFRSQDFAQYMDNLNTLPHSERSVVIRSIFGRFGLRDSAPGYYSTSTVQNVREMLSNYSAGKYRTYTELVR